MEAYLYASYAAFEASKTKHFCCHSPPSETFHTKLLQLSDRSVKSIAKFIVEFMFMLQIAQMLTYQNRFDPS